MIKRYRNQLALTLIVILGASVPAAAQEQDFFSALFGGAGGGRAAQPQIRMPFAGEGDSQEYIPRREAPRPRVAYGGSQAWCVRSCDGRYFPITGAGEQGRAAACDSFCPASETKVVYGSSIDSAATDNGKPYSELPNAFRYRNEMVAGCTCNGRDQTGLAPVKIEDDPTLRKGDIVAGADGLVVANRSAGRHTALNFTPVSPAIQARYRSEPAPISDN
ncbi:MAG TPA: DUF2865 domain-containing protein [Bradyrhizobium sp.]